MSKPSICIGILNYNQAWILPRVFKHLEQQTVLPDEVIIVDDCSTDNSIDIIKEFKKTTNLNTKLILHTNNTGAGHYGCNDIIDMATSDYIFFLAADDSVFLNFVEVHKNTMAQIPHQIIYASLPYQINKNTGQDEIVQHPYWRYFYLNNSDKLNKPIIVKPLLYQRCCLAGYNLPSNVPVISAKHAKQHKFIPELKYMSDGVFLIRLCSLYGFCHIPQPLTICSYGNNRTEDLQYIAQHTDSTTTLGQQLLNTPSYMQSAFQTLDKIVNYPEFIDIKYLLLQFYQRLRPFAKTKQET